VQKRTGRGLVLIGAAHHDLQRVVGRGALQRLGLVPRRAHPDVALLICCQNYRHRFRVDRRDHRVGRRETLRYLPEDFGARSLWGLYANARWAGETVG
jgi:hypothetical protein